MKMSKRKTFCQDILFADAFTDMPLKVRWLYICLNYGADDDGFVESPNYLSNVCQCTKKDLQLLADKGYLILFESGVVLITHWYVHNKPFRADRYHETQHQKEKSLVWLDPEKVYRLNSEREMQNDSGSFDLNGKVQSEYDCGDLSIRG